MKFHLLAHRGVWSTPAEQNTLKSFDDAFRNAWGIEFDVRDHQKQLIVSHDMPHGNEFSLAKVLELYNEIGNDVTLAINIKSDGLVEPLKKMLADYNITNYFVFDMSLPETVRYSRAEMTIFMRRSEYENYAGINLEGSGIWLDNFGEFADFDKVLKQYLEKNMPVAIVSPELHKREYRNKWAEWKTLFNTYGKNNKLYFCTDYPQEALTFFEEK